MLYLGLSLIVLCYIFSRYRKIILSIIQLIGIICYYKLFPRKEVEKFGRNYIKIPYEYRDKKYFHLLKTNTGLSIQSIKNENDQDVSEFIEPYLGPDLKLCGTELTPADFGYERLVFMSVMDQEFVFEKNDVIKLNF
jgi:hypothetical protein